MPRHRGSMCREKKIVKFLRSCTSLVECESIDYNERRHILQLKKGALCLQCLGDVEEGTFSNPEHISNNISECPQ